jgi:hypothetical protein
MKFETIVVFRKWRNGGDIVAIFPEIPATNHPSGGCLSYQHVGQHGACGDITHCTDPASEAEYAPLARELESIGYSLKIVRRRTAAHQRRLYDSLMANAEAGIKP